MSGDFSIIGRPTAMIDAAEKTTGVGKYTDDLSVPGMLTGKILHSPYPHALIKSIDTSRAEKCDGVVAVGWPKTDSGFGGVEVFIEGQELALEKLRSAVAKDLPEYMVPRRFHFMDRLPRNANNKYDRKAMQELLEEGL